MTTKQTLNPVYVQKTEKKIAIMQAHLAGKKIELRNTESLTGSWIDVEAGVFLAWDFSRFEYRIKAAGCLPYCRYLFRSSDDNTARIGIMYQGGAYHPSEEPTFIRWIDSEFQTHSI